MSTGVQILLIICITLIILAWLGKDDNSKKSLISLIDTLHNLAINDNQDK